MSAQERRDSTFSGLFFENRLAEARQKLFDSIWIREYRKEKVLLHTRTDPETKRRAALPTLAREIASVKCDQEGILYLAQWRRAKVAEDYEIIGSTPQTGRDYAKNPLRTKISKRLVYVPYRQGIDVLVRGATKIKGKYSAEDVELGIEAKQMQAIRKRALERQCDLVNFAGVSNEEWQEKLISDLQLLEEIRLIKPYDPLKLKIKEEIEKGVMDRRGRKNYLGFAMRLYSIILAAIRRQEGMFPATLKKYAAVVEIARLKRESVRQYMNTTIQLLDAILNEGGDIGIIRRRLVIISMGLFQNIDVRPYALGARKVIEHFGYVGMPENMISGVVQKERSRRGQLTVKDYLEQGDLESAKALIQKSRNILQKVLDVHADWRTVKPSRRHFRKSR